jgi:hypothetical protein
LKMHTHKVTHLGHMPKTIIGAPQARASRSPLHQKKRLARLRVVPILLGDFRCWTGGLHRSGAFCVQCLPALAVPENFGANNLSSANI